MPNPTATPPADQRLHQAVNRSALVVAAVLAVVGLLRLLNALISGEALPLRPVDGWALISLRVIAVLFSLGMLLSRHLRKRYLLLLLSLVLLTASGLWLRLGSLLPPDWHPTAGAAQLVMSVLGLGLIVAGLVQGEDLVRFVQDTWVKAFARKPHKNT